MFFDHDGNADLHLHTTYSDGHLTPIELIDKVAALGLRAIAIVDHDDIGALPEAIEYGQSKGLEVLPGVELSVNYRDRDIHILGYCFDYKNSDLVGYLELFRTERIKRARRMVEKLAALGMRLSFDEVLVRAGNGSVGRPHIANALLDRGLVGTFQEAFDKYLGDGKPASVDKYKIDILQAQALIKASGGLCSIAHPGLQLSLDDVQALITYGVQGIEVIHPKHCPEKVRVYQDLASKHGLLETGGSDFHGGPKGEESLGRYTVSYATVAALKQAAGYSA